MRSSANQLKMFIFPGIIRELQLLIIIIEHQPLILVVLMAWSSQNNEGAIIFSPGILCKSLQILGSVDMINGSRQIKGVGNILSQSHQASG